MQLEFAIDGCTTDATYPYLVEQQANQPLQFDYAPMVMAILQNLQDLSIASLAPEVIAS